MSGSLDNDVWAMIDQKRDYLKHAHNLEVASETKALLVLDNFLANCLGSDDPIDTYDFCLDQCSFSDELGLSSWSWKVYIDKKYFILCPIYYIISYYLFPHRLFPK